MDWDRFIVSKLFLAVPELQLDEALLKRLTDAGIISSDALDLAAQLKRRHKNIHEIALGMRNLTLIERIMLVAPELMSTRTVAFLRGLGLIDVKTGNLLRATLRAKSLINPGSLSDRTVLERFAMLFDTVVSPDLINYIRNLDDARILQMADLLRTGRSRLTHDDATYIRGLIELSITRAQVFRSVLAAGKLSSETLTLARNANGAWDVITVVLEGLLSDQMLHNAVRAGVISAERYNLIQALSRLGIRIWRVTGAATDYDSMVARGLMLSEGVLSLEMIKALRALGVISPTVAGLLNPSATIIRQITRNQLGNYMTGARVRPIAGESPIATYARVTRVTDRYLLQLLADAAKDAEKEARLLAATEQFGKMTKAAQQRLIVNKLHKSMHDLYERIGHLTIFGEREAARAADEAMDFLQNKAWKGVRKDLLDRRRLIQRQADAGLESFISRSENAVRLSSLVYKNWQFSRGIVNREVSKALLRGLNATDFARIVAATIDPGVSGGVSYAAMRLARTEINNAFHFTSIRYTREMPWVEGYRWNLSGSHPHLDVCNDMANANHDGIGRGVYKKGNVPGKPHPHCLCYITTVTADSGTFERQLRNGSYDRYFKSIQDDGVFQESDGFSSTYTRQLSSFAASAATGLALTAGFQILVQHERAHGVLRGLAGI